MNDSSAAALPRLCAAVRRRLWLRRAIGALRAALWSAAALALLALLAHLVVRPLPPSVVLLAPAAALLAALVWSATQRPADARCAAWIDRELGGASAFTTLLDAGRGRLPEADADALHWLHRWAAARVPGAMDALAARREPTRLARPFAAALVSTALALLVLALPRAAPTTAEAAPATAPPAAGTAAAGSTPVAGELAAQVASALRDTPPRADDEARAGDRGGGSGQGLARPGGVDDERTPAGAPPPGAAPTGGSAPPETTTANADTAGVAAPSVAGVGGSTGREAGDSADTRDAKGLSRVAAATMQARRVELARRTAPWRADERLAADYDDDPAAPAAASGARAGPAVAAATAPPAAEAARLTASENSYVQAWMTAIAHRR